jgi:ribonuclease-3
MASSKGSSLVTERLEPVLGLRFRDPGLLQQALVHRSFLNEQEGSPYDSYERMEFLGDAVLELVISNELYQRCPDLAEGELTKSRAALVRRETLAGVARRLDLGSFLLLGKGEEASGGRQRESILAAAFEALVAAVYLDQNYAEARRFILRIMAGELEDLFRGSVPQENPKSHLQEFVQGQGQSTPQYRLVSSEGPDHGPVFTVEVLVDGQVMGVGQGGSKAGAEKTAAMNALVRLAPETIDGQAS